MIPFKLNSQFLFSTGICYTLTFYPTYERDSFWLASINMVLSIFIHVATSFISNLFHKHQEVFISGKITLYLFGGGPPLNFHLLLLLLLWITYMLLLCCCNDWRDTHVWLWDLYIWLWCSLVVQLVVVCFKCYTCACDLRSHTSWPRCLHIFACWVCRIIMYAACLRSKTIIGLEPLITKLQWPYSEYAGSTQD